MSDFFSPAKIIDQQNVEALNAPNVMPWQKQNQPEQAPSVQAQKFQPSNPDSAPSDPEQEESGGFWSDWDKRSEEVTTEQTANQSRYGVDLNPDEYEILNKYISGTTDDPAEMEQNSYRMATALKYSNMFGISLEDAAQNLDKYNLALFGPDAESRDGKSLYHAVVDSFEMGNNTMKQGAIGLQMRNAELRGETALADSLRKEYELIENDSAELSKDVPRKWYAEALKYGAQSAPFTLSAVVAGLIPGIGPAAAFGVSYYQTEGLEYMEMRKDGATPETASCVGALSGGLQAVVEVALGDTMAATGGILKAAGKQVLGEQARSVLIDKITESVFKRMHYSGAFKAVAKGLMRYAGENVEEGLEEVVQEAISLTGKSVAAAMDDYQIEHKSAADIAQDLGENFKGGFLGSLVLGLPVTALNTTAALKDYADVKKKAETVQSEQAFKADMEKSPVFAGMDDKTKAGLVDEVWRNAQPARDREAAETLSDVKESADVGSGVEESEEDENGERVQRPAEYRDEGGRIHTEFDSQAASENDGAVKGRLLAGDPTRAHSLDDGGNRYGYIDYEENDGKVEITAFKMAPGREDIAPEFYREFAERFAGEDISWTPQQATNVALKKRIMEENPNGVKAGLNYYADEESVADVRARMQIADSLAKSSPKLNAETRAGVVALFEARASKLGMSLSDMVSDHYSQGIFTNGIKDQGISEGIAQTEAAGKGSVLGGTVFSKDGKLLDATQMVRDAKALVYVSKNSDFNTAAHEFAHTVLHYMTEGEMQAAEDAFKVEDHQWTVDKQEAFADGFVDYLRTGKAPSAGLKELFSKCATWLAGVFRGLQGKIDMNPELQKMYASLLADDGTGLAHAERAVKEQERMSAARRQYESETDDVNNKSEKEETNGLDTESSVQAEQEGTSPAEQKSPDDAASKIIEDPAQPVEAKVQAATDSAGRKYFQALNKDAPASRWTTGPNGENLLDGQEAMLFQQEVDGASEKLDVSNYFNYTYADFKKIDAAPERSPDYVSKSGSRYWYEGDSVIRESDHWGHVSTCTWLLDGADPKSVDSNYIGKASLSDFSKKESVGDGIIPDMVLVEKIKSEDEFQKYKDAKLTLYNNELKKISKLGKKYFVAALESDIKELSGITWKDIQNYNPPKWARYEFGINNQMLFQTDEYDPRRFIPKVRGSWTETKILKYLKEHSSLTGFPRAARLIAEFNSVEELKSHMFYHGTPFLVNGLKPSITFSANQVDRLGGGHGDRQWGISVTTDKKVASNFSSDKKQVNIYPVVLAKNAVVETNINLTDAVDVEKHIADYWNRGIDAVLIGNQTKDMSEKELLVLNPSAIVNIGTPDTYDVIDLKNGINIKNNDEISKILEVSKQYVEGRYRGESGPKKPSKPLRFDEMFNLKSEEVYQKELQEYDRAIESWNKDYDEYMKSDQYRKERDERNYFEHTILFQTDLSKSNVNFSSEEAQKILEDEDEIPEGWYIHGNSRGQSLENGGFIIECSRSSRAAIGYAKQNSRNDGSVWLLRPNKNTVTLDFSNESTDDIKNFITKIHNEYKGNESDLFNYLQVDNWKDAEEKIISDFEPNDIIDTALAYDDAEELNLCFKDDWPDFIKTPDGAILFPGSENNVDRVNLTAEAYAVTSPSILFQTEKSLLADAATFDSWEDFKAFYTDSLNRPKDSAVPEGADDAWYREAYSRAKQIEAQGTYDDEHATKGTPAEGSMADSGEKDRQFAEMIRQPGKLDEFLKAASRAYLSQDWQPVDYEDEQDMQESKRQRERVRSEMKHGTWVSSILAAHRDADKETVGITGRARKTLLSLITRNGTSIRDYRDLYADVMHDDTWSVPEEERTERILAERIQSPDEDAFRVLTPEQRAAMADELDFEDLKKELRDGTMQMDMDTVQNLADGYEREIDMQKSKIKRIQAEDANTAEKLVKRNAELEKARYDLEAAQKKKGQLEGVRDIKLRLIKSTMRRVDFKNVDYEYGRKIIAIQKMFSPTLNKMVQKFIDVEGPYLREAYSRFKTDADYREKLQIIADNGSRKAREVVKLFSKPFDKWTDAEMNMAAKSLPRTDWVESLNLEQLEKDRNGSIQMDVQDEETQKLLKDTLPADIYALLSRKDLKLWTLEEMEGLTAVVSDLYKTGRDNLRAEKEAKLASAAEYRIRIEKALKSSGIVVNPDDPDDVKKRKLEDIERFRNKELPKILGTGAPIKGTLEASERERSWLDRVVHGYGDRNIRRIARLLDNGREGVNTGLLYYREDECYNGEQRSVTARTNKILKAMEDNKVKMEDLFKKYQVKFSDGGVHTFTADELLFFESAARDRPDYAKMTDKEALNGDPTSFEAVACGNMYDDTVKQQYYAQVAKGQTEYLKKCIVRMDECIAAARKLPDNLRALMTAIQDDYTDQYERMNRASIDEFNQPVWRVKDYVPLNRLESNGDTNMNLVKEDMLGTSQGTGSAGGYVGKGMTQKRIHIMPTAQRPVVTGLYSTWASSMQRTEHFIHYASYVRDLNRVYNGFNSRSTRQYMDNRYGRQMHAYIEDYIKELANPNPQNAKTDLDRVIRALRGRTAPAYLAWKTSGVVKQFCTSPWPYMQYVSPLKYAAACIDCVKDGKLYDAIKSKSAYMNSRVFDPMVDLVNEQKEKSANGAAHALSSFEAAGMKGLEWVDWACVAPGWLAVYRDEYAKLSSKEYQDSLVAQKKTSLKSFEDVNGPAWVEQEAEKARMSDEEIERLAVRKADDATRMCQPSSRSTDLSPMFKTRGAGSEAAQVLLQFTTSLNVIWQNIRYDMPDAVRNRQWRQVVGTVAGYTMAGIAMGLVTQGLPKDDGDDDDEKRRKDLLQTLYYGMTQYTDAVPVVGSMVSDVVQGVMTGKWNFGTSDMFPITTKTTSGIKDISKGDWEKACSDFGYALGLGMGLPVSGAKEAGAVLGVGDGDGKADFYPQALVGRRKNK